MGTRNDMKTVRVWITFHLAHLKTTTFCEIGRIVKIKINKGIFAIYLNVNCFHRARVWVHGSPPDLFIPQILCVCRADVVRLATTRRMVVAGVVWSWRVIRRLALIVILIALIVILTALVVILIHFSDYRIG